MEVLDVQNDVSAERDGARRGREVRDAGAKRRLRRPVRGVEAGADGADGEALVLFVGTDVSIPPIA